MKGKIRILPKILSDRRHQKIGRMEKPSIGKPFPEELKDKIIYKEITKDAAPYNEDGDGTKEKAVSLSLCAGSNGKCGSSC